MPKFPGDLSGVDFEKDPDGDPGVDLRNQVFEEVDVGGRTVFKGGQPPKIPASNAGTPSQGTGPAAGTPSQGADPADHDPDDDKGPKGSHPR